MRRIPRIGDDKLSVGKPAPARVLQAGDESPYPPHRVLFRIFMQHNFVKMRIVDICHGFLVFYAEFRYIV